MRRAGIKVSLSFDHQYDVHGMRYPPDWYSMRDVALDEASAKAGGVDVVHIGRGRASPRNLATWASVIFDSKQRTLRCVSLDVLSDETFSLEDLSSSAQSVLSAVPEAHFNCLVCGSRGGQVTLPALWLLGCRLPCVVLNGGCARQAVAWAWPAGLPVVLLTGGADFFNEHGVDEDSAYLDELWAAVPPANRASTAILHVPRMYHRFEAGLLTVLLPQLVRYACCRLASEAVPTGHHQIETTLVNAASPKGYVLRPAVARQIVQPPKARASCSSVSATQALHLRRE